jgi:small subunit ribosomal protein S16
MVKIRLTRLGTKNKPFYRIVAIDERQKAKGTALEILGFWHPSIKKVEIDKAKVEEWTKKGALITPAVKKLITK